MSLDLWWSWLDAVGDWLYELMVALSYLSQSGYAAMNRGFDAEMVRLGDLEDEASAVAATVDAVWAAVAGLEDGGR